MNSCVFFLRKRVAFFVGLSSLTRQGILAALATSLSATFSSSPIVQIAGFGLSSRIHEFLAQSASLHMSN